MFEFPKSVRLRSRRQFQRVAQQPTRLVGHWVTIESRQSKYPELKLGITVSRHFGNAVKRNRFKRIVREAFRLCRSQLVQSQDVIIKPRQQALTATPADIQSDLFKLLSPKVT